jgi:uncharacterized protein (TIGR02145 family)
MKNVFVFFVLCCSLNTYAQNILIGFTGSGDTSVVSSVKVENLMKGISLTINGDDMLRLDGSTGINPGSMTPASRVKMYPNPSAGSTIIQIYPPEGGNCLLSIYDMTGKLVAQKQEYLSNTIQEFRFSANRKAIYLVKIQGNNYEYSDKIIYTGNNTNDKSMELTKIDGKQNAGFEFSKNEYKNTQNTVDMEYTTGDRLKFTAISGKYRTVYTDVPASDKTINFHFNACNDGDNNSYSTVEIGIQTWMAENLRTRKYNDETSIPLITDGGKWIELTTAAYSWYNNDSAAYDTVYGALYNWYTVNTEKLCPLYWHVPSDEEWTALFNYLGAGAADKLNETGINHWNNPYTTATNETGFTAIPGGYRELGGSFFDMGTYAYWWSSTGETSQNAWFIVMGVYQTRFSFDKRQGYSIRCLKD